MKTWEKPTLIVLVRGKPQEAIMTMCKTPPEIQGFGAESAFNACFRPACVACSLTPDS
jgi:hypothetical protein